MLQKDDEQNNGFDFRILASSVRHFFGDFQVRHIRQFGVIGSDYEFFEWAADNAAKSITRLQRFFLDLLIDFNIIAKFMILLPQKKDLNIYYSAEHNTLFYPKKSCKVKKDNIKYIEIFYNQLCYNTI